MDPVHTITLVEKSLACSVEIMLCIHGDLQASPSEDLLLFGQNTLLSSKRLLIVRLERLK